MLYILATPIGNLADISKRAVQILSETDLIIAENPTYSKRLFDHLGLDAKKYFQFAEHNEQRALPKILAALEKNNAILLTDAGTPGISDPGYRLVHGAIKNNIAVSPIPGPNAAIAALSASGLPTDKFLFLGFVPKTEIKLTNVFAEAKDLQATIIFYESPQRIAKTLTVLANNWPGSEVVIARELTKVHEEFIRGSAIEVLEKINARGAIKGELTVLVSFK